jgi:NADP-dependent 3-hydroxy acid dehydrogenase YdfG
MKIWFVTGASRGFGSLVTEYALARGDAVVATARNPRALESRLGDHPNLRVAALDVTDETQTREAAAAAMARFGRIDVLLNNAGYGLMGAVEEASAAEVEAVYRTNVFGMLNVTRAVLPFMRKQRSGLILNVSSIGGSRGGAGFGVVRSFRSTVSRTAGPTGLHCAGV